MSLPSSRSTNACAAGALTALLGVVVLAGWALDRPLLKSLLAGAMETKANAALGLVLAGSALFMLGNRPSTRGRRVAVAVALAASVLGLATLGEHVFGWRLGIDELLFGDTGMPPPARRAACRPTARSRWARSGWRWRP